MPGFNRTGPRGMGPMTGGGRGYCNPSGIRRGGGLGRGYGVGRGMGFGRGMMGPRGGRGFGQYGWEPYSDPAYAYAPQMSAEQELDFLRNQSQALREELENIEARISEMEGKEN